jgi:hypothetical protein
MSISSCGQARSRFEANYRESDLPVRRADVTKTGILFVENSSEKEMQELNGGIELRN